jgi:alkylation response protein AidB-like acyl-CoA dehydrogenase
VDLDYTQEERSFRQEVRDFLRASLPPEIRAKMLRRFHLDRSEMVDWQHTLNARGWAVPHWPVEWGGRDWSAVQRYILGEELQQWPAPDPLPFNVMMIGPILAAFGSDAQKRRFLPAIANLDMWFCQGFSEPGSGSDLASLRTRAERDGDAYVVNGQKMWTSGAHNADWMFALVRTAATPKPHQGISMVLIDMRTPGIEVRPIRTIDGVHHTNEVFLTDVRVPAENLVGEENRGWDYARFLLGNERVGIARIGLSKGRVRLAKALADRRAAGSRLRDRIARLEIDLKAAEMLAMRILDAEKRSGGGAPDPMASILKLCGADAQQRTAELLMDMAGPRALGSAEAPDATAPWFEHSVSTYFFSRAASIYGGTTEVQKNILSRGVLGF